MLPMHLTKNWNLINLVPVIPPLFGGKQSQ